MRDIVPSVYALAQSAARIVGSAALFDIFLHKAESLIRASASGYVALFHYLFN